MKKIMLFFAAAVIVVGCTLTEKVVFNAKGGGEIYYELDGSEFADFMASMDSTGKSYHFGDSMSAYIAAMQTLNTVNGIHQVKTTSDAKKISVSFSFDDIDALNKAHMELGIQSELLSPGDKYEKVTVKNKKEWIYRTLPLGTSADDSSYSMMGFMLTHKLDVSFPKAVQSTDARTITISNKQINWASTEADPGGKYAFDGILVKMK